MNPNRIVALLLLASTCLASANVTLTSRSPFIPDGWSPPRTAQREIEPPPRENTRKDIEFRGVYQLNGTYFFNIYDKRERKGSWLRLNIPLDGVQITTYNADNETISLNVNGEPEQLVLVTPEWQQRAVQIAQPTNPAPSNRPNVTRPSPTSRTTELRTQRTRPNTRRIIRPSRTVTTRSDEYTERQIEAMRSLPPGIPPPPPEALQAIGSGLPPEDREIPPVPDFVPGSPPNVVPPPPPNTHPRNLPQHGD